MIWRVQYTTKGLIFCILSVISMALMVILTNYPANLYESIQLKDLHNKALFHPLEQLVVDWSTPFITDIYVTEDKVCPGDYKSIFSRKWLGTHSYCQDNVLNIESGGINNLQCPLTNVYPRQGTEMSHFNGKTICGKLSDLNYLHATRVNPETFECPGVFVPCSNKTSPQNTICVHP